MDVVGNQESLTCFLELGEIYFQHKQVKYIFFNDLIKLDKDSIPFVTHCVCKE